MRYIRRQQDGAKVSLSTGAQMLDHGGALLWKTRTVQAFMGAIMVIAMMLIVLVIGESMSVVRVGLSLPRWPQVNLQAVSDELHHAHRNIIPSDSLVVKDFVRMQLAQSLRSLTAEEQGIIAMNLKKKSLTANDTLNGGQQQTIKHHRAVMNSVTNYNVTNSKVGKSNSSKVSKVLRTRPTLKSRGDDARRDEWIQFPVLEGDETEQLMLQIMQNGTLPCHDITTERAQILGLPLQQEDFSTQRRRVQLYTGIIYDLTIVSIGNDGQPRCAGGDYYETDLSGPLWKSRPPVLDLMNGTYSLKLQMDPRFAGVYNFTAVLLFSNFHAMHYHPRKWARMEEVAAFEIEFIVPEPLIEEPIHKARKPVRAPKLPMCRSRSEDFQKKHWSGRWTRQNASEDCEYNRYGRWQCVDPELQCQKPWCEGSLGSLESNGWVYSAHCAFKIFNDEDAWKCLDGKWLFFWGDSNHIDTIRNLLNFVLGYDQKIRFLDRRMDTTYFSPPHNRSSVRLTSMFNGHSNVSLNYEGLFSLRNEPFAEQLRSYFTGETAPDFMIMNSGLHDGVYWKDVERFMRDGVEFAADFWTDVWNNMQAKRPDLIYRTTVSTGGHARNMSFNPHKMELFNHLMVDRFLKMNLDRFQIIDGFDYTYPWHYDHKTNDGVHYGRPPSKSKWAGGNIGHRYFVDLMLVHILLNAICPSS